MYRVPRSTKFTSGLAPAACVVCYRERALGKRGVLQPKRSLDLLLAGGGTRWWEFCQQRCVVLKD